MNPLEGVTVVEISTGASAPYCGRVLADWGARVIKIERPGGDVSRHWDTVCRGLSAGFVWLNRNKESVVLDLAQPVAQDVLSRLVGQADVVVHNQMSEVARRRHFSYADAKALKHDIIYCQISGYGPTGPYADTKAYDLLMQGETGVLAMTGSPEAVAKVPLSICDLSTGLFAAAGVLAALQNRTRTGEGTELAVSMFGAMMDWLGYFPYSYWERGELPARVGAKHHLLTPYGPYRTRDGDEINLAALSEEHWVRFCREVIRDAALLEDSRYATNEDRVRHREALEGHIAAALLREDADEWARRLTHADLPWGKVNTLDAVLAHPALVASGQVRTVDSSRGPLRTMDNPVQWSIGENRVDAVPELGEQTTDVLRGLGYSDAAIDDMLWSGAAGGGPGWQVIR
jgi:itaconate CoA-transferase